MSSHTQQRSLCALDAMTSGKVCAHWYIDYSQYVNLALQAMNAVEAWQQGFWLIGGCLHGVNGCSLDSWFAALVPLYLSIR